MTLQESSIPVPAGIQRELEPDGSVRLTIRPYSGRAAWTFGLALALGPAIIFTATGSHGIYFVAALALVILFGMQYARSLSAVVRLSDSEAVLDGVHYRFRDGWRFEAAPVGWTRPGTWMIMLSAPQRPIESGAVRLLTVAQAKYIAALCSEAQARPARNAAHQRVDAAGV